MNLFRVDVEIKLDRNFVNFNYNFNYIYLSLSYDEKTIIILFYDYYMTIYQRQKLNMNKKNFTSHYMNELYYNIGPIWLNFIR